MIGGEFDLSSGVAVVTAAMVTSVLSVPLGLNLFVGMGLGALREHPHRGLQRLAVTRPESRAPDHAQRAVHAVRDQPGPHEAGHEGGLDAERR